MPHCAFVRGAAGEPTHGAIWRPSRKLHDVSGFKWIGEGEDGEFRTQSRPEAQSRTRDNAARSLWCRISLALADEALDRRRGSGVECRSSDRVRVKLKQKNALHSNQH